jgi:hypothetical protein
MTVKRDLKRRVRQRQARTGEAYVTARRHVIAARADASDAKEIDAETDDTETDDTETDDTETGDTGDTEIDGTGAGDAGTSSPATAAADPDKTAPYPATIAPPARRDPGAAGLVIELVDVTTEAWRLGFMCRVAMFPALIERIEPAVALLRLRDLLVETAGDPQIMLLSQVALTKFTPRPQPRPLGHPDDLHRFIRRARAGMGGVSEGGSMLAFHAVGRDGIVPIICALDGLNASLVLSGIDDLTAEAGEIELKMTMVPWRGLLAGLPAATAVPVLRGSLGPTLSVIHDGRWYPITQNEFVIGRNRRDVHLAIKDDLVSRRHAAVIHIHGKYYLKDLGSIHGIYYKGMQIDNKRIDEGDVFRIGDHELRFTYRSEDER